MSGIIVEKRVVVKAVDQMTAPLARMNQQMDSFMQKASSLGMHFSQGTQGVTSFKDALNQTKITTGEASSSIEKLHHNISGLKSKDISVKAETTEADTKLDSTKHKITGLKNGAPIKPKVDDTQATRAIDRIKNHMRSAKEAGTSMTKSFVVGGLITNGLSALGNEAINIAKNGFQAAVAGQQMAEGWKNVGMSASQVKATGNAVKEIKENSDLSGAAVGRMITRFYGLTGSAKQARTMAYGVATLADKLHLSGDQADRFTTSLTRIESSGKVTSQSLGRLERTAPGLGKALQQASGMSKKSFDDLVASGKMTSSQFNDILSRASKNWKSTSADWDKTVEGQMHHIKAQWADTQKALMAPLVTTASSGLGALSKSLNALTPLFAQLGESIGQLAKRMADWLTPQHVKALGEIVSALARMAGVIGKAAWKTFETVVNAITWPFRELSGHIGKSSDGLTNFANGLNAISKNKLAMDVLSGVAAILTTQLAYGKLFKVAKGLFGISDGLLSIGKFKFSGHLFKDIKPAVSSMFNGIKGMATKAGTESGQSFMAHMSERFIGKGQSWSGFFKGLSTEAEKHGTSVAKTFMGRFGTLASGNATRIGTTLGGKLSFGLMAVMAGVDIFKGLHEKGNRQATDMGKGFGTLIGGGIGGVLGGPVGMAIGSMLGGAIGGKLGPSIKKAGHGAMSILNDIFVKHDWPKAWDRMKKGFTDTWKGLSDWWDKLIGKKTSSSSHKSSSSKEPSDHEIRSLGGNHYSKADIANVKAMNAAVRAYTSSLKRLKDTIKHDDPTKELNTMNQRLSKIIKSWDKLAKPIDKISKSFTNFKRAVHTISDSIKQLTGKHGLNEFDKDLKNLEKDMAHNKLNSEFDKLAKSLKKSNLVKQVRQMAVSFDRLYKSIRNLRKPMQQNEKEMNALEKAVKKLTDKKSGLMALDDDIKTLNKDLVKYNFGKRLSQEMSVANKAVGRHGFTKEFNSMVHSVISDLKSFSSNFRSNWTNIWRRIDRDADRALDRTEDTIEHHFNQIISREHSFARSFNSSWKSWLSNVVSSFRSAFDKFPGIAGKAAQGIVSRLNRGISGINKVIGDFGGDKRLGTISYARGTFAHPGGKAIINDGPQANKTELVWQPSKGWGTFSGQNRAVDLEAGSMVMDATHSAPVLNRVGGLFPHYADGSLSDEEMDKLAEQFENNPVAASKQLILKLTDWSGAPINSSLGKAEAIGFSRGIANVLKDLIGEVKNPVNGDWTPVIRSAAAHMGVAISAFDIKRILNTINHESRGSQTVVNDWDSNAAKGTPSIGLLQFIQPTFDHYAVAGHHNIRSGYDQLLALFNDSTWRSDLRWNGGWGPNGPRRRATGGHITALENSWLGDNPQHSEYVINPYNDNALPLMKEAYAEIGNARPELKSNTSAGNGEIVGLLKEVLSAVRDIHLQPVLPVDETRRQINRMNATDVRLMS